jgi:branched-subunit amino acid aminotransferase/4-amino-4-deoxychorismate lyase
LLTPPLRDDLLPGVIRRALLDLATDLGQPVALRNFGIDELASSACAFWTSSLSGLVPITAVDGDRLRIADRASALMAQWRSALGFPAGTTLLTVGTGDGR